MHILSIVIDTILAGYVTWEVLRFGPQYRQLKQDIANGDSHARTRVYQKAIVFEWVSALLALLALGFDWSKLNPKSLALEGTRWMQAWQGGGFEWGGLAGVFIGLVLGTAAIVIARIRSNRRGAPPATAPVRNWRKLLPDFSALIPTTTQERLIWAPWPSAPASARRLSFGDGYCPRCIARYVWMEPRWSWWQPRSLGWRTPIRESPA